MSRFLARSSVFAVLAATAALLVGLVAGPASAHSALVGSDPEQGAKVATAPERVTLTFNENLKSSYAVLKVVGPDGHFWQQGEPTVDGRDISVALHGLGPAGEYKVNYRVTSADGHPVEGQVTFELTAAGNGTPGAVADDWQPETDNGVKVWPFIVGGVVVVIVVAGVLALLLARRRR
ncbi:MULTISPECIES: copper resistance CopC family protein [Gordonia]|uniref:Copper resistance protein CopC n=2 Tax=Gordonia TaxID=2053 RepID=A0ABP5U0Q7_9ACTN|nr:MULTISPECIES: copper resistance CopC family protein [Gordonia]KXT57088.1 copper resistance protein CopC [Gordonia sp. QH-12]MBY4569950.1 copper resistance protein CopC [Gordonia sihwensis]WFN93433.1 copper resistance protein CopC [Gordonia sihwensis]GAC59299.1 putative copper resistance protein [Gordonia sihwensis NBRC 108236]